jgi:LuxR family maltose regulon positive regulatory protein
VYLERPRINRLKEKAVQNQIIIVKAGAGCGKTHAVYSFVRSHNVRTGWIQCSELDNRKEHLWENVISAVSIASGETAKKLKTLDFPDTDQRFSRCVEAFLDNAISNDKYIFVYDDIDLITDKTILRFLERSVTNTFPNVTTILIFRSEPAMDLPKPGNINHPFRVTADDLKFTRNEMASYFSLQGIAPAPQTASAVYYDTEGWPFAIHLAGLSLKNSGGIYVPQNLRINAFKLFEAELMANMPPELRSFLIKLSLLENLNPHLLKKIEKNSSIIRELERFSPFIIFDKSRDSCRVHRLFLEYLRELQNELREEEKKEVWSQAAVWCAANNQISDAIINYEKAGDYNGIVAIQRTLPLLLPAGTARFMLDVLDRGPESIYSDFPEILIVRCRALLSLGLFEQGNAELNEAIPNLEKLPDSTQKHYILLAVYLSLGLMGIFESVHTRRYDFAGLFSKAAEEKKLSGYTVKPPISVAVLSSYACRVMSPAAGEDIEEYIAMLGEITPDSVGAMGGCHAGLHDLALGEYAFFRGDVNQAEKHLLESMAKARKHQQFETENRALFYLLRVYLYRGIDPENILSQFDASLKEELFLNRHIYHDIVTGWYNIQSGLKKPIAFWLKSDYEKSGLNARAHGLEILVKAKYFFSEKRCLAALAAIENLEEAEPLLMGDIEKKALQAVCRFRLPDREGAYAALGEAYRLAAPAGLFMPFAELGRDMRSLIEAAKEDAEASALGIPPDWLEEASRNSAAYAKKLYRLRAGRRSGGTSVLSRRETEVLIGLSQGLTREEIAGAASISPNTVKSAVRSIYSKLGALNQADAVRIAAEKGILFSGVKP